MAASLLGLFLSNSFSASYLVFKVTSSCFLFVVILNTIHKQFSFMHQSSKQSNLKTPKRRKNIRIRKFEHDIFWIPFTVTSSGTIRKNQFLKSKFELHQKKSSREPNNLFDLNDFSNYRSSNYMSSTVFRMRNFTILECALFEPGKNGVSSGQCAEKAYVGPYQTSMAQHFAKIVNGFAVKNFN